MPTKIWKPTPVQQDRDRDTELHTTDQPRSFDTSRGARVANADGHESSADLADLRSEDEPINTHGSER